MPAPSGKPESGVFCVRNQVQKPAEEHLLCPYCHGRRRELVEGKERRDFCDYDAAADPVSFGFPDGTTRENG